MRPGGVAQYATSCDCLTTSMDLDNMLRLDKARAKLARKQARHERSQGEAGEAAEAERP